MCFLEFGFILEYKPNARIVSRYVMPQNKFPKAACGRMGKGSLCAMHNRL